ncbi:forkhead activin signal transducer 3-like [Rana temporaria]|uniref:forkhead activin signal transducer 3-like n=1 Tax=Rana temporaria TaxID=8407 RepID=UPI001AACC3F6|nr:forkhead activin signal transducer 3-like [Rana temporaria]
MDYPRHFWDPLYKPVPEPHSIERILADTENSPGEANGGPREPDTTDERNKKCKKKNYQRYAKPPYTYLAMIALVIQTSPERKLKLSQVTNLPLWGFLGL